MYFLTNYCLFMSKVEKNNITIWKISILILYISRFLFFAIKLFTKITIFGIDATFYDTKTRANKVKCA